MREGAPFGVVKLYHPRILRSQQLPDSSNTQQGRWRRSWGALAVPSSYSSAQHKLKASQRPEHFPYSEVYIDRIPTVSSYVAVSACREQAALLLGNHGSTELSGGSGPDVGLRGKGSMHRALLGDLQQLRPLFAV